MSNLTIFVDRLENASTCSTIPLIADDQQIGTVRADIAESLKANAPQSLLKFGQFSNKDEYITLQGSTFAERSQNLSALHAQLSTINILPHPAGENIDIKTQIDDKPIAKADRNLVFPLGLKSWGVHLVLRQKGTDFYYINQRSDKVFTWRGCFDVPVGGVLPSGADPWKHTLKEAEEENGLTAKNMILKSTRSQARVLSYKRNSAGFIDSKGQYQKAYPFETDGGINHDENYYWSVRISGDLPVVPKDGEVKRGFKMTAIEVLKSMRDTPENWKPNAALMILDDMMQNGFIPKTAPDYDALKQSLEGMRIPDRRRNKSELLPQVYAV